MNAAVYQAQVVTGNDPLGLGRIKVLIPQVTGSAVSTWAAPTARTYGPPPAVGSTVWVCFDTGDPSKPVYHAAATWSPWSAVPSAWLAAGWSGAGASYRTGPAGKVEWRGAITTTTSPQGDGAALFTVPAALAPASSGPPLNVAVLYYPGSALAAVGGLKLDTTGAATLHGATITFTGTLTLCLPLSYSTI